MAVTSSRVCKRPAQPVGMPVSRTARSSASNSAALVRAASRPPFSSTALPLLSAREAICTSASGRLSNTTPNTPMGQLIRYRFRPGVSSRASSVLLRGSGSLTSAFSPPISWSIFLSFSSRRLSRGGSSFASRAASTSALFSLTNRARLRSKAAAIALSASLRCVSDAADSSLAASRAVRAICATVISLVFIRVSMPDSPFSIR